MPHPLFGADHWSRAARPSEPPHEQQLRVQIEIHQSSASERDVRKARHPIALHRRLTDWLPRLGAWIRDMPLP